MERWEEDSPELRDFPSDEQLVRLRFIFEAGAKRDEKTDSQLIEIACPTLRLSWKGQVMFRTSCCLLTLLLIALNGRNRKLT